MGNSKVRNLTNKIEAIIENNSILSLHIIRAISQNDVKLIEIKARQIQDNCSEESMLVHELYNCSVTDSLTGLKNKNYFYDIKKDLEGLSGLSCLMVDIDHFKRYNDRFGHFQGDRALSTIAKTIKSKSESDIIIRFGGEEFAIIFVGYENPKKLHRYGEKIRRGVERKIITPFSRKEMIKKLINEESVKGDSSLKSKPSICIEDFFNDRAINFDNYSDKLYFYFNNLGEGIAEGIADNIHNLQRITVSVGGSFNREGETLESVMNRADQALYEAKLKRNSVVILE